MDAPTEPASRLPIRTLRFKVHPDARAWLNKAAMEVNRVWNYANETSFKAARPYVGKPRWLRGYDLCKLTAGATEFFEHIGADTIQKICAEYARKRIAAKKVRLRWRKTLGVRRSLGWVPFKAASLRRHGRYLRFCGKSIRFFKSERLRSIKKWREGCLAQDAVGDWYLCLPVELPDQTPAAKRVDVGLDLGLKSTAVTSDGERLEAGRYYRGLEPAIARAQRRGYQKRAKRLHRQASRRRLNALHRFSRQVVNTYQRIFIGM